MITIFEKEIVREVKPFSILGDFFDIVSKSKNILAFTQGIATVSTISALTLVRFIAVNTDFKTGADTIISFLYNKMSELISEKVIPVFNKIRTFFVVKDRNIKEEMDYKRINEHFPNAYHKNSHPNILVSSSPSGNKQNRGVNILSIDEEQALLNPEGYNPGYIQSILDKNSISNEQLIMKILNNSEGYNPNYLNNIINNLFNQNHSTNITGKNF